jgi:hypothetical protein
MGVKNYLRSVHKAVRQNFYFLFKPEIHIISDSHGEAFKHIDFKSQYNINSKYCIVHGATASGLANPNSNTQAYPIFKKHISEKVKKNDHIIFLIGEVDCGFTIWLMSEKKNLLTDDILKRAVTNYTDFISDFVLPYTKNIIICSAILPTIKDGAPMGEIANLRREIKASQKEKTALTLNFNNSLREFCLKFKLKYINLDSILLNETTKVIKEEFLNEDILDHHPEPTLLAKELNKQINSLLK